MLFFDKESPFRKLPTALVPEQRVWLDAIRGSCEMAELTYQRLRHVLAQLINEQGTRKDGDGLPFHVAMSDAWTFVDVINRLRIILIHQPRSMRPTSEDKDQPKPEKVGPSFKDKRNAFLAELDGLEDIRNAVQHLDGEIDSLAQEGIAVWGSLTWYVPIQDHADRLQCKVYGLTPGPLTTGQNVLWDHPQGETIERPLGRIRLHAHRKTLNLSKLRRLMESPIRYLEEILRPQFAGRPTSGADFMTGLPVNFTK